MRPFSEQKKKNRNAAVTMRLAFVCVYLSLHFVYSECVPEKKKSVAINKGENLKFEILVMPMCGYGINVNVGIRKT